MLPIDLDAPNFDRTKLVQPGFCQDVRGI